MNRGYGYDDDKYGEKGNTIHGDGRTNADDASRYNVKIKG